ncbi:hypothetical protein FACS189459_0860 [Bacilli bacterium]|nr:hypothetical protein FACS189459_0860 [Bacilli bacterium]
MDKLELKNLAKDLYFDLNDSQLNLLIVEFDDLISKFSNIDVLVIDSVKPTNFCINTSCSLLREDIPHNYDNCSELLKNTINKRDGYVVIK